MRLSFNNEVKKKRTVLASQERSSRNKKILKIHACTHQVHWTQFVCEKTGGLLSLSWFYLCRCLTHLSTLFQTSVLFLYNGSIGTRSSLSQVFRLGLYSLGPISRSGISVQSLGPVSCSGLSVRSLGLQPGFLVQSLSPVSRSCLWVLPERIYNSHYGNGVPAMFTS